MNDLSINQPSSIRRLLSDWWPYLLVLAFLVLFPLLAGATIGSPAADGASGLSGLMQRAESGAAKFWQGMIIQILIFAIFAMSYDLLLGYTGILSFGHAMFRSATPCSSALAAMPSPSSSAATSTGRSPRRWRQSSSSR